MMRRILLLGLLAGMIGSLGGCAGMKEAYNDQVCNRAAGYERGMNDARASKAMDQSFTQSCYDDSREVTRTAYREGYEAGLASMKNQGTQINLTIGGNSSPDGHRFYCQAHAFMSTFDGWGATEAEARVDARNRCAQKYHEMHCQDVTCRRS